MQRYSQPGTKSRRVSFKLMAFAVTGLLGAACSGSPSKPTGFAEGRGRLQTAPDTQKAEKAETTAESRKEAGDSDAGMTASTHDAGSPKPTAEKLRVVVGSACETEMLVACKLTLPGHNGVIACISGYHLCESGLWSECLAEAAVELRLQELP